MIDSSEVIVPIIILAEEDPSEFPENIQSLPSIVFRKGTATNRHDLEKCHVRTAAKVVVLSNPYLDETGTADSDAIIGYMDVLNISKNAQILMELVHEPNLRFLRKGVVPWAQNKGGGNYIFLDLCGPAVICTAHAKEDKSFNKPDYYTIPEFASGQVCTFATMDSLLCQIYYQEHLVDVAKELVFGINGLNKVMVAHESEAQSHTHCFCSLMAIPNMYHGRHYGEFFSEFVNERNLLPLGLYRCQEMTAAPLPYVFTAPPSSTILHENDKVYVLSRHLNKN